MSLLTSTATGSLRRAGDRTPYLWLGLGWFEEEIAGGADFVFVVELVVAIDLFEIGEVVQGGAGGVELPFFVFEGQAFALQGEGFFLVLEFAEFDDPAGKDPEFGQAIAGLVGQIESEVLDGGGGGLVEGGIGGCRREGLEGKLDVLGAGLEFAAGVEALEGIGMGLDAEAFRGGGGDFFEDLARGIEIEPGDELVLLFFGESGEDAGIGIEFHWIVTWLKVRSLNRLHG